MRRLLTFVCLALALAAGTSRAAVVLSQALSLPGDGRASHVSNGSGFVTYDRITLGQTVEVNRVTWIGAFINTVSPGQDTPTAKGWSFQVAQDSGSNTPGALRDSATVAFDDVTSSLLGQITLAGQTVDVYSYTAELADVLLMESGMTLWFTVFAKGPDADPRFAWLSGSGGDGVSEQIFLGSSTANTYADRALTLEGTVPEPSTLSLLLMATLAMRLGAGRSTAAPRRPFARLR